MTSLINRLHRHLAQLSPHQRDRESGRLLEECLNTLVDAEAALKVLTSARSAQPTLVTGTIPISVPTPTQCGPDVRSSPWKDVYQGNVELSRDHPHSGTTEYRTF